MLQYQRIHGSPTQNTKRSHGFLRALRRSLVGLGFALALVVGTGSWVPPAYAASFGWAYLWANNPSASLNTPSPNYQFNSSGVVTNTVLRTGVGAYTAMLPNLGASAGIVHVTAYGATAEACKVVNWGPSGSTQRVNIRCFNSTGTPVDTRFTMTYAHPASSTAPMAFLWADQPFAAWSVPNAAYQFNSTGAINSMVRTGVGAYTAKLPGLGAAGGHVQVTAYGPGSERCKVVSWFPSGSIQQVNVQCFSSVGTPVDTRFTMTYVSNISLVGSPCCSSEPGTPSAYAWADKPAPPVGVPVILSLAYQFNDDRRGINTLTRWGTGIYTVQFPYQWLDRGDVQVTAYGSGSAHCKVTMWTPGGGVEVRCFSSTGAPVDTRFDVTFLASYLVG